MQIEGNASNAYFYRWYSDFTEGEMPVAWVLSLPLWVYRGAMLLWSLWLAFALVRWARWTWHAWSDPEYWFAVPPRGRAAKRRQAASDADATGGADTTGSADSSAPARDEDV